jgi:DNA polymerase III subunit epsilon
MYAIIDIETTGASAANGKITEIAVFIHNGTCVINSFTTLINPECNIPWNITHLTGITNEMVAPAPKFYEIAKKIVEITAGKIFVAHNSAFDYSFIREEFKRLGYDYKRKTICTVNLSRKLIPGHRSYSLGNICNDLGITIDGRHRAVGDAYATVKLFEILLEINGANVDGLFANRKTMLTDKQISSLPGKTGVYYFYDNSKNIIYIGKSTNIHQRILSHLNNTQTKKAIEMRDRIADVGYEETGSELVALLLESDEIKKHKPLYNRSQRRSLLNYGIFIDEDRNGYLNLEVRKIIDDEIPLTAFHFHQEAVDYLHTLAEKYGLCKKLCHLDDSNGACFNTQINNCSGACTGNEDQESYNSRVNSSVKPLKFRSPDFFIIDFGRNNDERAVIKVRNGRYSGFGFLHIDSFNDGIEVMHDCIKSFTHNRDTFNIIRSYINQNAKAIKIIEY